jgi:YD repeat-containing protein
VPDRRYRHSPAGTAGFRVAESVAYLTNVYNGAGQVTSQTIAGQGTYTFTYNSPSSVTVKEPDGTTRDLGYNSSGYLVSDQRAAGTSVAHTIGVTVSTSSATADLPAAVTDGLGRLADTIPDALVHADSVARLGRAVAVTLIAATQRPTQQAMGQRAIRSQMDVRVAFRVREKGDADLILGCGMRDARRRLARGHPQRTRQVPHLRTRARRPAPCPRLPADR